MARPRKPTQLHVISGSAQKHPDRMREREAEPVIEGDDLRDREAPEHLDRMHADLWNELRGQLYARVASDQDATAFEALVRLVMVMRTGQAGAPEYARLQAYLGEFGMTPASRSKVAQGKKAERKKGFAALKAAG
jgi:phage terminase small subunit